MEASLDSTPLAVPMDRLSKFVRQLSHDVRNGLNAIDLQATLIAELADDPETADEAKKLRVMVGNVAQSLQHLGRYFAPLSLNLIEFPAKDLVEAVYDRMAKAFPDDIEDVVFQCEVTDATAETDFELVTAMTCELFKNAFEFREPAGAIRFRVQQLGKSLVLKLSEQKTVVPSPPATWGLEPLVSSRRGGMGLGLYHARRIVAAHGGTLEQSFADGELTTRVSLPLKI